MTKQYALLLVCCITLSMTFIQGCGDDDDDSGGNNLDGISDGKSICDVSLSEAEQICRAGVDVACEKAGECSAGLLTKDQCIALANPDANCTYSEGTGSGDETCTETYTVGDVSKCFDDYASQSCEDWSKGITPTSCDTIGMDSL
jgi:hypothetical protein